MKKRSSEVQLLKIFLRAMELLVSSLESNSVVWICGFYIIYLLQIPSGTGVSATAETTAPAAEVAYQISDTKF